jgi:hypothetical protein
MHHPLYGAHERKERGFGSSEKWAFSLDYRSLEKYLREQSAD